MSRLAITCAIATVVFLAGPLAAGVPQAFAAGSLRAEGEATEGEAPLLRQQTPALQAEAIEKLDRSEHAPGRVHRCPRPGGWYSRQFESRQFLASLR